jgi:hypothetical protein
MEVDYQLILIQSSLSLKGTVLPKESQKELTQLVSNRSHLHLLLLHHRLVDPPLHHRLTLVKFIKQLTHHRTTLLMSHTLLRILLPLPPKTQHQPLTTVILKRTRQLHLTPLQLLTRLSKLGFTRHEGQFLSPETNSLQT